jgi:hypothetical protein
MDPTRDPHCQTRQCRRCRRISAQHLDRNIQTFMDRNIQTFMVPRPDPLLTLEDEQVNEQRPVAR